MTPEQLKASILQRAMEGKLVPQDPNDEPASELLKRIKAEKEKLIKEGKIKRDKNETEIFRGDDGLHYEKFQDGTIERVIFDFNIPDAWELTRLRNIGTIISGGTPKTTEKDYYNGNIPWITPSDMGKQQNKIYFESACKFISEKGLNNSSAQMIPANSIVYSSRAPIGHINIVNTEFTTNQGCKSIFPLLIDNEFLYWLLKNRTTDIQLRSSGTTFKEISLRSFGDTIVCIPPYKEQKRITRKISSILRNINNYEKYYVELEKLKQEFPEKLQKSILQYAMQGKLVSQDATDEPVEVLLEKIREEKQKLFTEGKLKKKDLQESIIYQGDDNSYYEKNGSNAFLIEAELDPLQNGWCYKCLSDLIRVNTGLSYKKENLSFEQEGVRILRGGNISPLHLKLLSTDYFINKKYVSNPDLYLQKNQILTPVSTSLQHIGKFARVNETYEDVVAGGFVFQLTPFMLNDIFSQFMEYALSSHQIYKQLINITNLSGQALYNIPKSKLMKIIIALPSLDEQERINSKLKLVFSNVQDLEKFL